jgi:hypothetical protein
LNRLVTLTYAGAGCHDQSQVRADVAQFVRNLRSLLGGEPFPYLWVAEWHKTDHGLHLHLAVGRYIPRSLIEAAWGRGFVHIKLLGDLPVGSGSLAEARLAARYLSKYVGKSVDERREFGLNRYDCAQGFQPEFVPVWGPSAYVAIDAACDLMGGERPDYVWTSNTLEGWCAPPAVWASWPG